MRNRRQIRHRCVDALPIVLAFATTACTPTDSTPMSEPLSLVNFEHLDYLGEEIALNSDTLRIIHIYADAPSYAWIGDDDEGIACVDDAARAIIVYLKDFELTENRSSARKAKQLLRFVMYMQTQDGLFYNFVWDSDLNINKDHQNSVADEFSWWTSRAVWALGQGVESLFASDPAFALQLVEAMERTLPHLDRFLEHYGSFQKINDRNFPKWLVNGSKANATSEMLLGLIAYNRYQKQPAIQKMIDQFSEGIAMMQFGSINQHPYLAHAATEDHWNGWGNSQTQALSEAGFLSSAEREASSFYPRLLIDGWKYSFSLSDSAHVTDYPQIAYAVRVVTMGLLGLYQRTADVKYARMAGLAASWFTGNNVANIAMYDPLTGRGFDGINSSSSVNYNSGAESTIEALTSVQAVEQVPEARLWLYASADAPVHSTSESPEFMYRIFTSTDQSPENKIAVYLNLSGQEFSVIDPDSLLATLKSKNQLN